MSISPTDATKDFCMTKLRRLDIRWTGSLELYWARRETKFSKVEQAGSDCIYNVSNRLWKRRLGSCGENKAGFMSGHDIVHR
jgi:hypothetical protein